MPKSNISPGASRVNNLTVENINGTRSLCKNSVPVAAISPENALSSFIKSSTFTKFGKLYDEQLDQINVNFEHFDSKTRVEDYMMEKAGSMIWNSVRMPAYFNNFLTLAKPNKMDDGSYVLAVPMEGKPMYLMDVEDLGGCTASIFNEPENYGGKIIGVATECITIGEFCDVLNKVLAPRVFKDAKQTADQMAKLGFPGAEEMASMFRLYQKGIERDINLTKKLNPKAKSWKEFVVSHKVDFESIL
ncbi:Hypothetical predicted protein [Paramuricea clavata]|uniref:NmrA-like family domain-containing protein 1 n=1 Tax=Paramuricea clavata TaxID=317549 RepID=A0A7D9L3F1_PARCT|nr:Hypothetical predicted protein [Paramuricea clavata]